MYIDMMCMHFIKKSLLAFESAILLTQALITQNYEYMRMDVRVNMHLRCLHGATECSKPQLVPTLPIKLLIIHWTKVNDPPPDKQTNKPTSAQTRQPTNELTVSWTGQQLKNRLALATFQ